MIVTAISDEDRLVISDETGWDGTLVFSRGEQGAIRVATAQEHAMDSHNENIENTYTLPKAVSEALFVWLGAALRKPVV